MTFLTQPVRGGKSRIIVFSGETCRLQKWCEANLTAPRFDHGLCQLDITFSNADDACLWASRWLGEYRLNPDRKTYSPRSEGAFLGIVRGMSR